MTRLLLLLLLMVAGLRIISGISLPAYMQAIAQATVQQGEDDKEAGAAGPQEKGTSKQENNKLDNDDKIHPGGHRFPAPIHTIGLLQVPLPADRLCSGFAIRPFTPPDLLHLHR